MLIFISLYFYTDYVTFFLSQVDLSYKAVAQVAEDPAAITARIQAERKQRIKDVCSKYSFLYVNFISLYPEISLHMCYFLSKLTASIHTHTHTEKIVFGCYFIKKILGTHRFDMYFNYHCS